MTGESDNCRVWDGRALIASVAASPFISGIDRSINHNLRMKAAAGFDSDAPVFCFTHDLDVGLRFEQHTQTFAAVS